uniref:F-box associated domain-containing protein n=1 Tax=Cajanus cajan TaxID=3821 RepID=A0A151U3Q1_CAJCA|nr:hypothetical protein KK1_006624 [Cajanus cajan]
MKFDMPVHHNGAIHFISNCASSIKGNSPYFLPYIMSYNFGDGKSRMLRVPKEANMSSHDRDMGIFKWGKVGKHSNQSICLVKLRKHVFTVWVLVNYETSLWKKVFHMKVVSKENDLIVRGFAVLNGDLLVFATEKKVYGIGLTDMMIQEICQHKCECNFLRFISYSDTLRTCGIGAETLPLSSHI